MAALLLPLGNISVAPAPIRSKDLDSYQQNVEQWARDVERVIRAYEVTLRALITALPFGLYAGSGSPAGVVAAPPGAVYANALGGAGATLYVKESGTGSSGWVAK